MSVEPRTRDAAQPQVELRGFNAALWVAIAVAAITIFASALTLYLAFAGAERELPAQYRSQGSELDADQQRSARATALGAGALLRIEDGGVWITDPSFKNPNTVSRPSLTLLLTHATLPALDRSLRLVQDPSAPRRYVAMARPLESGRWLAQLESGDGWRLRGELSAPTPFWQLGVHRP